MVQLNGPALGFFCFPSLPRIQVVSKLLYPCGEGTGLQGGDQGVQGSGEKGRGAGSAHRHTLEVVPHTHTLFCSGPVM